MKHKKQCQENLQSNSEEENSESKQSPISGTAAMTEEDSAFDIDKAQKYKTRKGKGKRKLIGREQENKRKNRNNIANALQKIYSASYKNPLLRKAIQDEILGKSVTISVGKKGKMTISTQISTKCKKIELMKFLFLMRKNLLQKEREDITPEIMETVELSIQCQMKKMEKNPSKAEECLESLETYYLLKDLVQIFLVSGKNAASIRQKFFNPEGRRDRYNAGVRSIQQNKLRESLKEFGDELENEDSWMDLIDLSTPTNISDKLNSKITIQSQK